MTKTIKTQIQFIYEWKQMEKNTVRLAGPHQKTTNE